MGLIDLALPLLYAGSFSLWPQASEPKARARAGAVPRPAEECPGWYTVPKHCGISGPQSQLSMRAEMHITLPGPRFLSM